MSFIKRKGGRSMRHPTRLPAGKAGSLKMSTGHFLNAPSCPHKEAPSYEGFFYGSKLRKIDLCKRHIYLMKYI